MILTWLLLTNNFIRYPDKIDVELFISSTAIWVPVEISYPNSGLPSPLLKAKNLPIFKVGKSLGSV